MSKPPAQSRCPKCHASESARIAHAYEYGSVAHDDSYCGRCGASWPKPVAVAARRDER